VAELELTDFDADRHLLDLPGTSLLIFTSIGCASCRWLAANSRAWACQWRAWRGSTQPTTTV